MKSTAEGHQASNHKSYCNSTHTKKGAGPQARHHAVLHDPFSFGPWVETLYPLTKVRNHDKIASKKGMS